MNYKLIIFDFDGTLADSFPWLTRVVNTIADKYRFKKLEPAEYDIIRGYEADKILKYLGVPSWKMPLIANHVRILMAQDIQQIPLFKGVDSLLRRLADKGMVTGVVSSNSLANVRHILGPENAGLIRYYECGVSFFGKSSKLKKMLKKSGIAPCDALFIGDETRDIEAAKNAGMSSGAVTWGYNQAATLKTHTPDRIFSSIDDITAKAT